MLTVYVCLLDEGTKVYRPVPAIKEEEGICILKGEDIYDPEIEVWEFTPGSRVLYESKMLDGEKIFVVTEKLDH